jgi:hypothetical protein
MRRFLRRVLILSALVVGVFAVAAGGLLLHDRWIGLGDPYNRRTTPHPGYPGLGVEWKMHPVDNPGDLLPNGLDAGDVDGDGRADYVTHYGLGGRIRVAFHPGSDLEPGRPWPSRVVGAVPDAESSALGDLDGDGLLDVIAVHGVEGTPLPPGLRVFWAADGGEEAWVDGGDLPGSLGGWHFLFVRCLDLDADGDLDLVAAGRASRLAFQNKRGADRDPERVWAGLRWFENPGGAAPGIRNLERWRVHALDSESRSGHGFDAGDLDGDGDLDLANANSDFDTPEAEESVVWYRNPLPDGDPTQAWPVGELLRSDEFYAEEQVTIADLDGDGRNDVVAHAPERVYWFHNRGSRTADGEPSFETRVIPKHEAARWRARPLEVADVDGDGALDLIGALIHRNGSLPSDKAALFWMRREGDRWDTRVIKWADGFRGVGPMNGEKWDQLHPVDVDGDGDLDLVANVREYNRFRPILAVVWFENPAR